FMDVRKLASADGVTTEPQPKTVGAQWIWYDKGQTGQQAVTAEKCYFRKTFKAPAGAMGAVLNITADDSFQAWLNPEKLRESAHPYFTRRVYSFDVKLKPGADNVLAVEANNA